MEALKQTFQHCKAQDRVCPAMSRHQFLDIVQRYTTALALRRCSVGLS